MDFEARLTALKRLTSSTTEAATRTLRKEVDTAASLVGSAAEYDLLEQNLAVLDAIGFRFSVTAADAIIRFIESVGQRQLMHTEQERVFGPAFLAYRTSSTLIMKAIQALMRLRYLETVTVLRALMRLSLHSEENVRKKALEGLTELSEYNIDVFFGADRQGGLGAAPQKLIVDELRNLSHDDIRKYFSAIVALLNGVLSPTMEGTSWSYKALTISHAATPSMAGVSEVRLLAVDLLERTYGESTTIERKLTVIGALTEATRTGLRGAPREEAVPMFVRDAQKVLAFFETLVAEDDLQIVQKIEHNTYWIYVHAIAEEIRVAALNVRDRVDRNSEYQFYRILIGFEGIFGDWQKLRNGGDEWKDTDELRRKAALGYAESISDSSFVEWRARILVYAQTKSNDMATFPIFYYFLEAFASKNPALAFRLLSHDTEALSAFLIPLLRGLWPGSFNQQLRTFIESWMGEGRNLYPAIKQFLSNSALDLSLAKRILLRAAEIDDLGTIREAVSVAVSNYHTGRSDLIEELMLPAIGLLTERCNSGWIIDNWYRRELKEVLAAIDSRAVEIILRNLAHLRELDYHAEELLSIIAQSAPDRVIDYLCRRLDHEAQSNNPETSKFDAIPYELYKLNEPLSRVPTLLVRTLRERYVGDYSRFMYGGARLLSNVFPTFSDEFEVELIKLVHGGEERSLTFVLAVLRNYKGQPFIHQVCKEIVKSVPGDSAFRKEVAIALETTGVVSGEFGMADAYDRKRQELGGWLNDPDLRVQNFAKWYVETLEKMRDEERKRAEEDIALRKFRYGEE